MTQILTYVEIDIPAFSQNSPVDSPPIMTTFRFAVDAAYLPTSTIYAIPSIKEVRIDPAIVSLGQDIGQRATVTVMFKDHRHIFASEAFSSGTFWGKFRARYGLKLRGYLLRVITGSVGQALVDMETRNFVIESTDGPSTAGEFKIIAKDVLKLADGDRSQAPKPSNGFLSAGITNAGLSATLLPAGIGNSEYPASGLVSIGASEIVNFTRAADVLTIVRAQKGTTAVAHSAQERIQLVLQYTAQSPADIIRDLLVTYALVPASYIPLVDWQAEIGTYLNTVYTATIAEPASVAQLISELIEQVGLILWWDDVGQQVRLQVLRPISSTADVYDQTNYIAGTLKVEEQPEKRLTQVYTYFAKLNPLVAEDQLNNYRSTSNVVDAVAAASYGTSVIKKVFSRWIPDGGRSVADTLGSVLLARFKDPPRRISFDLLRGSVAPPILGIGYQVGGWPFQGTDGSAAMVPGQITSLNPRADIFQVELEEISANVVAVGSPGEHNIIIDANLFGVNLRTMHDSIYGVPVSGNVVNCTINTGVVVGSTTTATPAFTIGTWPAGVNINLFILGKIEGKGGAGGGGSNNTSTNGTPGSAGGTALFTRQAITLSTGSGKIWGGGGGGGGGGTRSLGSQPSTFHGSGGGGGAGKNAGGAGAGGAEGFGTNGLAGAAGTELAGGAGGASSGSGAGAGGAGGGPGLAGTAGANATTGSVNTLGGAGGATGKAIDGISFVTFTGGSSPSGDIRGSQVN